MSIDFEFYPLTVLPRQGGLLHALVPCLAALDQISGVWLTGSLARGDADRWSSADLHLLWDQNGPDKVVRSRPSGEILTAINAALGEQNVFIEKIGDSARGGSIQGITLGAPSQAGKGSDIGRVGVLFAITWALSTDAAGPKRLKGATRPLYIAECLTGAYSRDLASNREAIVPPEIELIERQLGRFWLLLARLPAVVGREEQLATHMLLTEMHDLLIDMVVSLNGGSRPKTRARINQFLGPAQREAFERSLGLRRSGRQRQAGGGDKWIGQAVALVVLYRWYAPQLAEKHSLFYPQMAEDAVLALLRAELENWPASISTG